MKKIFIFITIFSILSPAVEASDQFGGFQQFVDSGSLKPFTRDLGSILGSSTFHSGRSLGLTGFDVGLRGGMQFSPAPGDTVMSQRRSKAFGIPLVQAEIGLPFSLDGFIRGISYQGLTVAGGGLRYSLLRAADKPGTPHLLLEGVGHSVSHTQFSASHLGVNLIGSMTASWVTPYLGAGFDRTRVVVRAIPALAPGLVGATATTTESRFTAGVSLQPKSFLYVNAAYTLTHGRSGMDTGLGVRF